MVKAVAIVAATVISLAIVYGVWWIFQQGGNL